MLAPRLGGVEVALDGHTNTAAHDAIAVTAAKRGLHARDALVGHTLQETDIEAELVPLDGGADDAHKGQRHAGLPVLGRLEDEVVERFADFCVLTVEGVGEI